MAGGRGGGGGTKKGAKEVLDEFGQQVHEQVKSESNGFKDDLKGSLSLATASGETGGTNKPCDFGYDKLISGSGRVAARGDPCKKDGTGKEHRFSKESGAECDDKKIEGNVRSKGKDGNNSGACAPYRRLSLCNKSMEKMDTNNNDSKAKHDLLADVCLAAKHEGQSIIQDYPKYQAQYASSDFTFTMCTVLARSFADIGDIVRGKDLYVGNRKEREKERLQNNLKFIFQKIYDALPREKKLRYNGDRQNYFQLREDWWYANRQQVWKAITCSADKGNAYFRQTCGSGKTPTEGYCRCDGDQPGKDKANVDPPTYFDYVPQYLRWFEEWAEDFCRKKKKKLENLEKQCRGNYRDEKRYCSRNGYDCTQTIRAIGKLVIDKGCINCLYACPRYEKWIANQKQELLKQKNKYAKEISNSGRQKRSTNNYKGYEKKFYDILKSSNVGGLDKFLELLSNENECKHFSTDEGIINFKEDHDNYNNSDKGKGTFYRSKYCEPCPLCGVKCEGGTCTPHREDEVCPIIYEIYNPDPSDPSTPIKILKSGEGEKDIAEKLEAFCKNSNDSSSLYEEWKCYYRNAEKEACIKEKPLDGNVNQQKSYNNFFYYWVAHMLKDSIHWRTEKIKKCLENNNGNRCNKKNKCNSDCDCFKRWVEQKGKEWENIKIHFAKQDFGKQGVFLGVFDSGYVLEQVLDKKELLQIIQDTYGNSQETEHIKQLLDETALAAAIAGDKDNTTIDKLLNHELNDAKQCLKTHPNPCSQQETPGRSGPGSPGSPQPRAEHEKNHSEEAEEEEEEEEEEDEVEDDANAEGEVAEEETAEDTTEDTDGEPVPPPSPPTDDVNVCETVKNALTGSLNAACEQKYDGKYYGWKCVTSGDKAATRGGVTAIGGEATGKSDGSICIPPRRRRLYVGKLEQWAKNYNTDKSQVEGSSEQSVQSTRNGGTEGASGDQSTSEVSVQTASQPNSHPASPSHSRDDGLREAFIQSAAIETFFLWHKYKAENTKRQSVLPLLEPINGDTISDDKDPSNPANLQSGKIPPSFLRQMFYTLGDYRDICIGKTPDGIDTNDKEKMKQLQTKIQEHINSVSKAAGGQPITREKWWSQNGEYIWKGMIYALTYKDNDAKGQPPKHLEDVRKAFFGDKNTDKPDNPGTYKTQYEYSKVVLKEDEENGPKTDSSPSGGDPNINTPTLTDFISRPPYFRYLEEWGQNFCKERKKRLEEVRKACRETPIGNDTFCSGDGHDCTDNDRKYNNMLADLDCRDCYKQCRKYRKWIDMKFEEYHKQEKKYEEEKQKLNGNSNGGGGDNTNFCQQIKEKKTAAGFLKSLKHCSNDQNSEDDKDKEYKDNKIDFKNITQTFSRSTYCETCPSNKVNCNGRTGTNPCTVVKGKGKSWKEVFEGINGNSENTTDITVEMIDRRGPYMKEYMEKKSQKLQNSNDLFKTSRLFKGIRKQEWECRFNKAENKDVCYLKNFEEKIDLNEYTTFKVFLVYWLEDFLNGYYILKKKKLIEQCKKNGGETCNENSKNDCACVKEWVAQKSTQWGKIQKHFNNRNQTKGDDDMKSSVKKVLEQLQSLTELDKVMQPCTELNHFLKSLGCTETDSSENSKEDAIDCMLDKLKKKTESCPTSTSGENQAPCEESYPEPDDEPLEEEENPENMRPNICPKEDKPTEADTGEKCDEEKDKEKKDGVPPVPATEELTNEVVEEKTSEAKPPPNHQPQPPTPPKVDENPFNNPHVKTALVTSTLAWSVGIGFATFTYFFLKVLYIYINIYVFLYMYLWVVFGCIYIYICSCICVCVYVCVGMFGYIFVYMYVFYIYFIYMYLY